MLKVIIKRTWLIFLNTWNVICKNTGTTSLTAVFIVNFEYVQHNNLKFSMFTLNMYLPPVEALSKPSQITKMELSAKIVNSWKPLTISAKTSILHVWQGSEYASVLSQVFNIAGGDSYGNWKSSYQSSWYRWCKNNLLLLVVTYK